jgi:hypothetical protein
MGCDMVVALGPATVNGQVLFGWNRYAGPDDKFNLRRFRGRTHSPGETIAAGGWQIPQVRRSSTVLGCQPVGAWGFTSGINEHHVGIGLACWKSKLPPAEAGLAGTDLVRLTLERSHSASQALEILTDLIARHGVGAGNPSPPIPLPREARGQECTPSCTTALSPGARGDFTAASDPIFLIADGREAKIVEAAGRHWATAEVHQVRAVSDVAMIRQDWQRLAPGLAELAIHSGWWSESSSKLDFAGSLNVPQRTQAWALKRWGRATLLLEQQNGHIDHEVLRRLLAEHYGATVSPQAPLYFGRKPVRLTTFLAVLSPSPEAVPLAWCALGPPQKAVYFPILLDGDLPEIFEIENGLGLAPLAPLAATESVESLQARWDQALENFAAHAVRQKDDHTQLQRQATQFMGLLAASLTGQQPHAPRAKPGNGAKDFAFVSE